MVLVTLVRISRRILSRKTFGLIFVAILLAIAVIGNALTFWLFERGDDGPGFDDALWYSIISVTTIGYGDYSATTLGARIGTTVFIVIVGLSAFSVFFGMIIDWVSEFALKRQKGLGSVMAADHVLIIHFPNAGRVRTLIEELRADDEHKKREIVVVSDQIDQLPFALPDVLFVHGSPLEPETYERADIHAARMAILLSRAYDDPNSDAIVASAAAVIESINVDVQTVVECNEERHRHLFKSIKCDAIVSGLNIAGNLLVQEVHDPGITQMVEEITTSRRGNTLYSTEVTQAADASAQTYGALAKGLLDHGINVLCVNRGNESLTDYSQARPAAGDRVIYVGPQRKTWDRLRSLAGA